MSASVGLAELSVPRQLTSGRLGVTAADLTHRYQVYAVATDVCSGAAAALIGLNLRFGAHPAAGYVVIASLAPLLWLLVIASQRGYDRHVLGTGLAEYRALANATLIFFVAIAVLSFTVKGELSRGFLLASLPEALLFSLLGRRQLRQWLFRRRRAREGLQRVLVVGRSDAADRLVRHFEREPWQGLLPVGVCVTSGPAGRPAGGEPGGLDPDRVLREVDAVDVDVVAVASHPDLSGHVLRRLAWDLDERGVELVVSPGIVEVSGPRMSVRSVSGLMLVHLERPGMRGLRQTVRSLIDRAAGTALLLALLPLMAVVAVAVKVTSPGPVLFRQTRIGVGGRPFPMLKFRSMVVDAEQRLAALLDDDQGNGMLFKLRQDPRVTRVGRVLRRYSLDELPQLWNVVRGDMSLVGPRPPLPDEVERYTDDARRRLRVKPGMTGLWQVSGRSDLSWEESLRLDLYYVDNSSFMLDVAILWRTIHAVFGCGGAY